MANLEIKECLLTNNDCYKQGVIIEHEGIVVHSSGANNPNLKRYVQPDDGILGVNKYNNHWNRGGVRKCVHAMIGKDKDGIVRVYQLLPWDYKPWGCGSGKKGSYNNSHIQFEILEDSLKDETYFNEAFGLAIELCAYLSKKFNIPVDNIVSHKEAHAAGYASNHGDCDIWLKKFSKDMNWFRNEVEATLNPPIAEEVKCPFVVGQKVKLKSGALYTSGKKPKSWVYTSTLYVRSIDGNKVKISTLQKGAITGTVYSYNLEEITTSTVTSTSKPSVSTPTETTTKYYPRYAGKSNAINTVLKEIGVPSQYRGSLANRRHVARANGYVGDTYKGSYAQNLALCKLAKNGKLVKVD